ncbi:MAG: YkgJ family cysteine cluster protein [Pseudomonadota bacterium]
MSVKKVSHLPYESSFVPEILNLDHGLKFSCHKEISCFNACCKQADVMLAPYDVIRLKNRLNMGSEEFLKEHTVPWEMEAKGIVGVKLRTTEEKHCLFITDEGCGVYEDRPAACRYYPFGLMGVKHTDEKSDEQAYFRIKEDHCKGFEEFPEGTKDITIREYRKEQGVEIFDELNRDWMRLMLKKKSAGPAVGQVSPSSLQLLFMATYDMDRFNRFLQSDNFRTIYNVSDKEFKTITSDDVERLKFGYRLMLQILFGEKSIDIKEKNIKQRSVERKEIWEARHQAELELARLNDPRYDPEVMGEEVMSIDSAQVSQTAAEDAKK